MRYFAVLGLAVLLTFCSAQADTLHCPSPVTAMDISKGEYSPQPGAVFILENFSAKMHARGKKSPLCFNRITDIEHGQVFVSSESLTNLFSKKVDQSDSKMHDVKVEIKDGLAHLSGKIKKVIDINFEIQGPVTTDGTNLILTAKKIKADGLPVKGLLGMVGKDLGSMLNSESVEGVKAEGDKLIFMPASISHVKGRIAKLDLTDKGITLDFEAAQKKQVAAAKTPRAQGARD